MKLALGLAGLAAVLLVCVWPNGAEPQSPHVTFEPPRLARDAVMPSAATVATASGGVVSGFAAFALYKRQLDLAGWLARLRRLGSGVERRGVGGEREGGGEREVAVRHVGDLPLGWSTSRIPRN